MYQQPNYQSFSTNIFSLDPAPPPKTSTPAPTAPTAPTDPNAPGPSNADGQGGDGSEEPSSDNDDDVSMAGTDQSGDEVQRDRPYKFGTDDNGDVIEPLGHCFHDGEDGTEANAAYAILNSEN